MFRKTLPSTTLFVNFPWFQECEESEDAVKPEIAELLAKCKAGLIDYQANVNTINFDKFATDMKNEQEFLNGLQKQLVPWMDTAEVTANTTLKKPENFDDARDIERQCVLFAKEVRKANKLLGKIDEASKRLARYQTTAENQIDEQVWFLYIYISHNIYSFPLFREWDSRKLPVLLPVGWRVWEIC